MLVRKSLPASNLGNHRQIRSPDSYVQTFQPTVLKVDKSQKCSYFASNLQKKKKLPKHYPENSSSKRVIWHLFLQIEVKVENFLRLSYLNTINFDHFVKSDYLTSLIDKRALQEINEQHSESVYTRRKKRQKKSVNSQRTMIKKAYRLSTTPKDQVSLNQV